MPLYSLSINVAFSQLITEINAPTKPEKPNLRPQTWHRIRHIYPSRPSEPLEEEGGRMPQHLTYYQAHSVVLRGIHASRVQAAEHLVHRAAARRVQSAECSLCVHARVLCSVIHPPP